MHAYLFKHYPDNGMQNCDEALRSIPLAGKCLLVKMLITLEPSHIFLYTNTT